MFGVQSDRCSRSRFSGLRLISSILLMEFDVIPIKPNQNPSGAEAPDPVTVCIAHQWNDQVERRLRENRFTCRHVRPEKASIDHRKGRTASGCGGAIIHMP